MEIDRLTVKDVMAIRAGHSEVFKFPNVRAMLSAKGIAYYTSRVENRPLSTSVCFADCTLTVTMKPVENQA